MKTVNDLLDALNARTGLSDRKLGALFGAGEGAVTAWRTGRAFPADEKIPEIARVLDLEPAYVAAIVNGARAKSDETRAMWQRVAQAFGKAAMLAIISAAPFIGTGGFNNNAFGASFEANTHCTRNRRRASWVTL